MGSVGRSCSSDLGSARLFSCLPVSELDCRKFVQQIAVCLGIGVWVALAMIEGLQGLFLRLSVRVGPVRCVFLGLAVQSQEIICI